MSGCSGGLNKPGSGSEDASDGVTDGGQGCVEKNHPEAPEDGEHRLDDPHDRSDDPHVQDGEDAEKGRNFKSWIKNKQNVSKAT